MDNKELSSEEICRMVIDRVFEEIYKHSILTIVEVEKILEVLNELEMERFNHSLVEEAARIYTFKISVDEGVKRIYNTIILFDNHNKLLKRYGV
jgi:hypothetical protein